MPLQERRCFHDFTPLFPVVSSVPGRPQPQILLFEVVLEGTHVFDKDDHEVVSTPFAGRRCRR